MGGTSLSSAGHSVSKAGGLIAPGTVTLQLPADVADLLQKEAKRHRKSISRYVAEWLEDQRDGREAAKRWKDVESGKTKLIPAEEVYKKLGLR